MNSQMTPPELVGRQFARWEIKKQLGRGGFAWVFKGYNKVLDRDVAIKILQPLEDGTYTQGVAERFLLEARMTSALREESTVNIYEFGKAEFEGNDYLYLASEFIDGLTLRDHITLNGPLKPLELVMVLKQVARSLHEAHTSKDSPFIHRDLKTVNIMVFDRPLSKDIYVKVLDFGIGKALEKGSKFDKDLTQEGAQNISFHYAAPEQVRDADKIGPHTDLFSLGVVAYECLTGKNPYKKNTMSYVLQRLLGDEPFRLPEEHATGPLAEIVHKLLEKAIDDRYASAESLLVDLENLELAETRIARLVERSEPFSSDPLEGEEFDTLDTARDEDVRLTPRLEEQRQDQQASPREEPLAPLVTTQPDGPLFDPLEDRRTSSIEAINRSDRPIEKDDTTQVSDEDIEEDAWQMGDDAPAPAPVVPVRQETGSKKQVVISGLIGVLLLVVVGLAIANINKGEVIDHSHRPGMKAPAHVLEEENKEWTTPEGMTPAMATPETTEAVAKTTPTERKGKEKTSPSSRSRDEKSVTTSGKTAARDAGSPPPTEKAATPAAPTPKVEERGGDVKEVARKKQGEEKVVSARATTPEASETSDKDEKNKDKDKGGESISPFFGVK